MSLFEATPRDAGLYWCMYKDARPNELLRKLMGRPNCFEVRTEGFDNAMDEFLHVVGFALPELETTVQRQQEAIVKMVSESTAKYKDQYLGQAKKQVAGDPYLVALLEGNTAFSQDDYVTAIAAYRRALELRPDDLATLNSLGIALRTAGQVEEAIKAYRRSLELKPDDPIVLNNLGIALRHAGQVEEGIKAFRRSLALRPDDPDALNGLGLTLRNAGQVEEAIKACQRSLELRPDDMDTLNTLGVALRLAEKSDDAQGAFGRVVYLSEGRDDLEAQINRMIALIGVGRPTDGIACAKVLIAKRPLPQRYLRVALEDLKPLAKLGVDGAQECVSMIEAALRQKQS